MNKRLLVAAALLAISLGALWLSRIYIGVRPPFTQNDCIKAATDYEQSRLRGATPDERARLQQKQKEVCAKLEAQTKAADVLLPK